MACGSRSTTSVEMPRSSAAPASPSTTDVLPTPPFNDNTDKTNVGVCARSAAVGAAFLRPTPHRTIVAEQDSIPTYSDAARRITVRCAEPASPLPDRGVPRDQRGEPQPIMQPRFPPVPELDGSRHHQVATPEVRDGGLSPGRPTGPPTPGSGIPARLDRDHSRLPRGPGRELGVPWAGAEGRLRSPRQ